MTKSWAAVADPQDNSSCGEKAVDRERGGSATALISCVSVLCGVLLCQDLAGTLERARAKVKPPAKEKKKAGDSSDDDDDDDDDATAQELGLNAEVGGCHVFLFLISFRGVFVRIAIALRENQVCLFTRVS